MSTHPLLIVSLFAFLIFVADACTVCGYDGRQYDAGNPDYTANGLCNGVANAINCLTMGYNTHYSDRWGQVTMCRLQCPEAKTCPEELTQKDPNGNIGTKYYKTFIGQIEIACDRWPAIRPHAGASQLSLN